MLRDFIGTLTLLFPLLLAACAPQHPPGLVCTGPAAPAKLSYAYAGDTIATLETLSASGDRAAARVLGERYDHGQGVPVDARQAAEWYARAAFSSAPGMIYMPGYGKTPGSILPLAGSRNDPGDPVAMGHLGLLYVKGLSVPKDVAFGEQLIACGMRRALESQAEAIRGAQKAREQ